MPALKKIDKIRAIDLILSKLEETGTLTSGFEAVAIEFNMNSFSVAQIWHQKLVKEFSEYLKDKGYTPKYPNRKRKNWTITEDLKFINIILNKYGNRKESIIEAFEEVSIELARPKSACSSRWYNHIIIKYKDHLNENNFEFRNWTDEEDELLFESYTNFIGSGKSQIYIFDQISEVLFRSKASCQNRWYSESFKIKVAPKLENLSCGLWKDFEKQLLIDEMKMSFKNGESMLSGIFNVSNKIYRNPWSVIMKWYELKKQISGLEEMEFVRESNSLSKWPKDLEDKLIETIDQLKISGKRPIEAIIIASTMVGKSFAECGYRYHRVLRKKKLKTEVV